MSPFLPSAITCDGSVSNPVLFLDLFSCGFHTFVGNRFSSMQNWRKMYIPWLLLDWSIHVQQATKLFYGGSAFPWAHVIAYTVEVCHIFSLPQFSPVQKNFIVAAGPLLNLVFHHKSNGRFHLLVQRINQYRWSYYLMGGFYFSSSIQL